MNISLLIALLGVVIAGLNVAPMMMKKLPKHTVQASFIHYFVATQVIAHIDLPWMPWWLKGAVLGLALMVPMLLHVNQTEERRAVPVIAANAVVFGTAAGVVPYLLF